MTIDTVTAARLPRSGARTSALLATIAGFAAAGAQAGVSVEAQQKIFRLDGGEATYVFGVDPSGLLRSVYWGPRLAATDTFEVKPAPQLSTVDLSSSVAPQEFPAWGAGLYTEPTLKVAYADGVRDVVLNYVSHHVTSDGITVELADIRRPLRVTLRYSVDEATGIIGRSAIITNAGKIPVRLDQASSAAWSLPVGDDYRLHHFSGGWGAEFKVEDRPITSVATVVESRRGSTSHQTNPWFAIDRAGYSTEESGPVWFGVLAWSGSWRISVDRNLLGDVRIVGGLNPFDFGYRLKPGESLETPVFYAGYSGQGMGGASRLLHRFERARIVPNAPRPRLRPIIYNSWEATEFAVDEKGQIALAEKAAKIGAELFVVDDGWFGARNNDKAGLGDWVVNPTKFPHGLKPLIDKVHSLGMEFGLWVEPEMVNPDSDLYRAHPDWVINFKGRPRTEARNQLVLNLARKEVRAHVLKVIDELLNQNDIQFIKWDYNRDWSEPGWPEAGPQDEQKIHVDYMRNLYSILAEIKRRHPKLEIESCSGGGGRIDLGVMAFADQFWTSDNTDPFDRLSIQSGFSHAYPPGMMVAWVTDSPHWLNKRSTSLEYRFLSSMQGALGVGANLNKWSDSDFAEAAKMIAAYKQVRPTVQHGNLYRLLDPRSGPRSATFYVADDRRTGVLFAFLHSSERLEPQPRIRVAGLDPQRRYRIREIASASGEHDEVQSGAFWMANGVDLPMKGDFQAVGRVFETVD